VALDKAEDNAVKWLESTAITEFVKHNEMKRVTKQKRQIVVIPGPASRSRWQQTVGHT